MWSVLFFLARKYKNLIELYRICQGEQPITQPEFCQNLVDNNIAKGHNHISIMFTLYV